MFGLLSKQYIVDIFLRIQTYLSDNCIRYLIRNVLYYNNVEKNEDRENHIVAKINKANKTTYEIEKANRRLRKEQKKQEKLLKVKSEYAKKYNAVKNNDSDLEEEDYELINENNQKPRKLKKLKQIQDDSSQNSNTFKQQRNRESIFDDDNQIDSSVNQNKKVKNEI